MPSNIFSDEYPDETGKNKIMQLVKWHLMQILEWQDMSNKPIHI